MKAYLARVFGWVRLHTMALAVLLLLAAILPPVQVQGQISPCCAILSAGLGTINTTLGSVIGARLSSINGVLTTIQQFEQRANLIFASKIRSLSVGTGFTKLVARVNLLQQQLEGERKRNRQLKGA